MKNILLIVLLSLTVLFVSGNSYKPAYAGHGEEAAGGHEGKKAAHGENKAHGGGGHGAGAHHGAPDIYYIYWALLLICLYRAGSFLKAHHKQAEAERLAHLTEIVGEGAHAEHVAHAGHDAHPAAHDDGGHGHHPQPSLLDKFLVLAVLTMFIFEQVPELATYHEASGLGFVKFLLKATLGVSLMTYGILGMGEH